MSDNEWHTVSNHKPIAHSHGNKNYRRRQSKQLAFSSGSTSKSMSKSLSKSFQNLSFKPSFDDKILSQTNPYHLPEDDDSDVEEEDEDQVDPIDIPLPPYHITLVINCPFDDCSAVAPFLDTTALVQHLKTEHSLVFLNLHHMYMALDAYLSRWASVLRTGDTLQEHAVLDTDVYVIDPSQSDLDKKIREDIQLEKLNEILKIQQREREYDSKQPRKCLFCKIVCDSRTLLFKHMFSEHNFNIGLPDNLVNVNEFLDLLETKLTKLQCLYCEKTFTSPAVLRKHMRKKKHFKIASKNRQYDRFYVINYLEPGKNWENFEHDHFDSDDEKKDESWADWEEEVSEPTMCLFDDQVLPSPKEVLLHMKTTHAFDLSAIRKEKGYDFYRTVILINYIRHQSSLSKCFSCGEKVQDFSNLVRHMEIKGCIQAFVSEDAEFWKDPRYMLPIYENDPLLTGFDDDDESDVEKDLMLSDDEANKKYMSKVMSLSLEQSDL
ncbi:uncharacterized protein BX664DRAFT_322990 [Halteromyces radiatus]|uniref:uncharacterized protein n=1 Tax=Halteromyces radiatus TaxID=101107 RepID=UPI002220787D|nr:uncharacterized protein BX664DRAFT_322990 [Halteromyces radiatus]KAI8100144.1 hypothetical protein BX664DRAFT_322990 [Halteromyces radiatus]